MAVDLDGPRSLEDLAAAGGQGVDQGEEVAADVELRLVVEPHRPLDGERQRDRVGHRRREAGCGSRVRLRLDLGALGG